MFYEKLSIAFEDSTFLFKEVIEAACRLRFMFKFVVAIQICFIIY